MSNFMQSAKETKETKGAKETKETKQPNYDYAVVVFRRDLRIHDNPAINFALTHAKHIIPIFIFDPEQINATNEWRSIASIKFMLESLLDLNNQLIEEKGLLHFYKGDPAKVISQLVKFISQNSASDSPKICVCFNADYTPFSKKRDVYITEKLAKIKNCDCRQFHDLLLKVSLDLQHQPYKKFTPFFKAYGKSSYVNPVESLAKSKSKNKPYISLGREFAQYAKSKDLQIIKPAEIHDTVDLEKTPNLNKITKYFGAFLPKELISGFDANSLIVGGRRAAFKLLHVAAKTQKKYANTRDTLSIETTRLSAHNKFGTVSIREVYEVFAKISKTLVQQLYWREFYYILMASDPHALTGPYSNMATIQWSKSASDFARWTSGTTGFPVVDAAMRELNATHYMHNRGRMIVASFLVKDLRINWRWGERYFATQLVDYDPAQNNYNWQWVAGTGPFAAPYFRVFNPWAQGAHHDPEAEYIKKWIPALRDLPAKVIHNWAEYCEAAKSEKSMKSEKKQPQKSKLAPFLIEAVKKIISSNADKYYPPMCDHNEKTAEYLKLVKNKTK